MKILKKFMQALVELLIFFPVILMMGVYVFPPSGLWFWVASLPLFYLAGICVRSFLSDRVRIIYFLIGVVCSGALAWGTAGGGFSGLIVWVIGLFLYLRGLRFMEVEWEVLFPPSVFWIGLFIYFVCYFFFTRLPDLKPFSSTIAWLGLAALVVSMMVLNFQQLKTANLYRRERGTLPKTVIVHNQILIGVIFLLIVVIARFKEIKEWVEWFAGKIFYWIFKAVMYLLSLFDTGSGTPGGKSNVNLPFVLEKTRKTSHFWDVIFKIFQTIAVAAAIAGLFYVIVKTLYILIKKLISLLSRIFRGGQMIEEAGYIDEKESLIDWKTLGKSYMDRIKEWISRLMENEKKWEDLKDNRERVRYLYRRLIISCIAAGYKFKGYLTPDETKDDLMRWDREKVPPEAGDIIDLYNKARYSCGNISDEEIKAIICRDGDNFDRGHP